MLTASPLLAQGPCGRDRQVPDCVVSLLMAMAVTVAGATVRVPRTVVAGTARVVVGACSAAHTDLAADSNDHSDPYAPHKVRSDPFIEPLN